MMPASDPNETSSSASVAISRVSTGENGGSLSSDPRTRSRAEMFATGMPMQNVSADMGETIDSASMHYDKSGNGQFNTRYFGTGFTQDLRKQGGRGRTQSDR